MAGEAFNVGLPNVGQDLWWGELKLRIVVQLFILMVLLVVIAYYSEAL